MSFPFFSLGFAPRSLTFPTSNVVKAIAIASLAALSVKMILNTVLPSQADDDHECHPVDDKVCLLTHKASADDIDADHLTQAGQDAELPKNNMSTTSPSADATDIIADESASHTTELAVAPEDVKPSKDVEIADDNIAMQGADSTEIVPDTKEACPTQLENAPEIVISTQATPIVETKKPAIKSSNGVRSYRHSFPAADIVEIVEIAPEHRAVRSYRHSFPAADIIEVVEVPSRQATVIASPILSNTNTAMLVNEEKSTASSDAAPKAEEVILNHTRKDSTALVTLQESLLYNGKSLTYYRTNFSTESRKTANSESPSTGPGTPDTNYSAPNVEAASQITPVGNKKFEHSQNHEDDATTLSPVDNSPSKWYDFSHLSAEEMANLDTIIVIERPDTKVSYTQLTCGFWYRLDEDENPVMMSQSEYEDLLAWFASFTEEKEKSKAPPPIVLVTDEEGNEFLAEEIDETSSESQVLDLQDRPELGVKYVLLTNGYWHYLNEDTTTAKPMTEGEYDEFVFWLHDNERLEQEESTSQDVKGIELLTYADEPINDNYPDNSQELSELEQWEEAKYIGPNLNIVGLIDHPDGNKQFAIGNDDAVYWLIDGMFCPLDDDELDRFHRWRDGDNNALHEPIEQLERPKGRMSKWKAPNLDAICEEDEEDLAEEAAEEYEVKKWDKWGLYTIEEVEEQEEEYSLW
ncbi:hypothetical protein NEUTE1DRAFT_132688 [Neurospora tetrasperma FGSC 2508]|uniref:Uncharacterized protein n=1 Tax=Neurospora tetrasperma (strain FGSC 2508 / ATCC MYA-4615 / P0657) TaxID=510951 RepID=F8N4B0_NEUT8|nr:uncharacterized protein NEUTE1DRAFT_132688 [Neurospora tetrasperma FGSC 2508]EGO51853.1 hypothetical protein NEUTE1DRAFT_132688 [Neurospora tetrasperma FGSC 2508]